MVKTKTGIKYCGGCNPNYEREGLVQTLQDRVGESFLFLHHEHGDLDGVIAVSGCPKACAAEGLDRRDIPYHSIMAEGDLPNLIDWLLASEQKKGQRNGRRQI